MLSFAFNYLYLNSSRKNSVFVESDAKRSESINLILVQNLDYKNANVEKEH